METRRAFLGHLGIAAAGLTQIDRLVALSSAAKLNRIGIQLYTVRRPASADLAGTLAQIAKIGYKEVEFAGYYGHAASDVRAMLDQNGLAAPSAHIAYEAIMTAPDKTFADAKTVGHQWITVPSLPRGQHVTVGDWNRVAAQFNLAATRAHDAGFRFAFHNHNDIVKQTGDVLPIDILMKETDPALVNYQMDIYWAVSGGSNPLDLLARYPGRFKMFHVKDGQAPWTDASQADVGQGTIDFKPIFAKAKGIEHYFVESDSAPDPIAFADASYKYLSNLEY